MLLNKKNHTRRDKLSDHHSFQFQNFLIIFHPPSNIWNQAALIQDDILTVLYAADHVPCILECWEWYLPGQVIVTVDTIISSAKSEVIHYCTN